MAWTVLYDETFEREEFPALPMEAQDELLAMVELLVAFGPNLRRPHADTLKGSRHANMKELRFRAAGGVWRVAYAFDPVRQAVVLVAGDKSGTTSSRFYKRLIRTADARFDRHLASLEE